MSFLGTMVFTGNVHKSHCPEQSRNERALSHWALSGPLAQLLPWVCFVSVMACDFAKMSPLRLHCHVAFAISMKISLFLSLFPPHPILAFCRAIIERIPLCLFWTEASQPHNYKAFSLYHFEIQTCHFQGEERGNCPSVSYISFALVKMWQNYTNF